MTDNVQGAIGGVLRGISEADEGGGALFAFAEIVGGDGEFFDGDDAVSVVGGSGGGVEFAVGEADGVAGVGEVGFIFKDTGLGGP